MYVPARKPNNHAHTKKHVSSRCVCVHVHTGLLFVYYMHTRTARNHGSHRVTLYIYIYENVRASGVKWSRVHWMDTRVSLPFLVHTHARSLSGRTPVRSMRVCVHIVVGHALISYRRCHLNYKYLQQRQQDMVIVS